VGKKEKNRPLFSCVGPVSCATLAAVLIEKALVEGKKNQIGGKDNEPEALSVVRLSCAQLLRIRGWQMGIQNSEGVQESLVLPLWLP
jgi:hypothetical protein